MRFRTGPLVLGLVIAAIGVVLLLRNLGVIPDDVSVWPVVVIGIGLAILLGALGGRDDAGGRDERDGRDGTAPDEAASVPLDGARSARIVLSHGAGVLEVDATAPTGHLLDGTFAGGVRVERRSAGERIDVELRHPSDPDRWFRSGRGLRWRVGLARDVPVDLDVRTGASRVALDLRELTVPDLRVQTGASEVDVRAPVRGRSVIRISAGAAEVRVHVALGTAASITNRSALAGVSVDERRFPRATGGFRSPDYDDAADRVEIDLEGGVASFSVD